MKGFMLQVVRRASVSAIAILLSCWPTNSMICEAADNNCSLPENWICKPIKIPTYYLVGSGGLLMVSFILCTICLCCLRKRKKRKRKEYFTDKAKESGSSEDNTLKMTALTTKEAETVDENDQKETTVKIQDTENLNIKIGLTSINPNNEKKSNEETEVVGEEQPGNDVEQKDQDQPGHDITNEGNETGTLGTNLAEALDETDRHRGSQQEIDMINGNRLHERAESFDGFFSENTGKPRAEPVYAEVHKHKKTKKKATSGYNIVYAELADFDKNRSDAMANSPRGNTSSAEYAEIARLTKSPRDMCPLDDF